MFFIFIISFITTIFACCQGKQQQKDLIILTDMQPDDRIALAIVAAHKELSERLLLVGTTLMNTNLKAALARRQLKQSGFEAVPVYAGSGGHPNSYTNNNVASAKAAFSYWEKEGENILPEEELQIYRKSIIFNKIFKFLKDFANNADETDQSFADFGKPKRAKIVDEWHRSIVIEGIPESDESDPQKRQKDDFEKVMKILNLLGFVMPPKYIYRLPKPKNANNKVAQCKVIFPVQKIVKVLLAEWSATSTAAIREQLGYKALIRTGFSQQAFDLAMKLNTINPIEIEQMNEREAKFLKQLVQRVKYEQFGIEEKIEEIKLSEIFTNHDHRLDAKEFNVILNIVDDKMQNSKNKRRAKKDLLNEIRDFFLLEEEESSIVIRGLPEPCTTEGDATASECYQRDFEMVCDLFNKIGYQMEPRAVDRIGGNKGYRGRYLRCYLWHEKLVENVLERWENYRKFTGKWTWSLHWNKYRNTEREVLPTIEFEYKQEGVIKFLESLDKLLANSLLKKEEKKDDNLLLHQQTAAKVGENELQIALEKAFENAKENSLQILLMTAPTDFVQVCNKRPELCNQSRIGVVHVMGGWMEMTRGGVKNTIWENYNLNMDQEASQKLFEMASDGWFSMRLYSKEQIDSVFGGSVNSGCCSDVIKLINASRSEVMKDFLIATKTWDENALKTMPQWSYSIGPYAGQQFTPADPILVVGLICPKFLTQRQRVSVQVEYKELYECGMLDVRIEYDLLGNLPKSKIGLVTGLSKEAFFEELEHAITVLSKRADENFAMEKESKMAKILPTRQSKALIGFSQSQPSILGPPPAGLRKLQPTYESGTGKERCK